MTDQLRANANLIDSLSSATRHGGAALADVPELFARVVKTNAWREFITQRGEHVPYDQFADFVTTRPLKGLGATMDLVRRVVAEDPVTLDLLDKAMQRPHGGDRRSEEAPIKRDNVTLDTNVRGNSESGALRKLRKDAPELHAKVLAKEMTAHAAMVQAGFRHPTVTIPIDRAEPIVRVLKRKDEPSVLAEVLQLLGIPA